MPTIITIGSIKIKIYPHDHYPPHIHAIGPDCEAKFKIENIACFFSRGFTQKDLGRIQKQLLSKQEYLMEVWNEYQED